MIEELQPVCFWTLPVGFPGKIFPSNMSAISVHKFAEKLMLTRDYLLKLMKNDYNATILALVEMSQPIFLKKNKGDYSG